MATKGTVFDEFIKSNSNFKDKFKGLLDKFLDELGDGLNSKKLLGDISIKDLTSFLNSVKNGTFLNDLQKGVLSGLDQFAALASDSLGALYKTGLGFAKSMLGSYIDALMSQVYIPEDVFLITVKGLKNIGSDPNYNGTLRAACLQKDLFKTIEWLDDYNGTTYDHINTNLVSDGVTAGKNGAYRVALYIMDKIKQSKEEYSRSPIDVNNAKSVNSRDEIINKYNYNLHLIAKNILMGSYDNFELSSVREMFSKYNLTPSVFGKKDKKFGGRVKINMNDINRAAPIYNKGSIAILHKRFKNSYKTTYICPRNHIIKLIYLYLSSKELWSEERMWNPEFHERMKCVIISTHLKNLSEASTSLLTTGLGQFIQDPQNVIDKMISDATKKTKPYLFDPTKQIYIRLDDTIKIPDVTEPEDPQNKSGSKTKSKPGKNPDGTDIVDPNIINGIDTSQFRVYTYEDINGDNNIDNIEFQNRIIDRVFVILKTGYFKRYNIKSIERNSKIYNASGVFTGSYEKTVQDFYIFSTFEKNVSNPMLNDKTFDFLVMKYLVDIYGRDRINSLSETYSLDFAEFLRIYDAHIASLSDEASSGSTSLSKSNPWSGELDSIGSSTSDISRLRELLRMSRSKSGLSDDEYEKYKEDLARRELELFEPIHSVRSKITTIKTPSTTKLSEIFAIYKWMKNLSKMKNNKTIENNKTNDEIEQYRKDVETLVNLSGKRVGINALSSIEDAEEQIIKNPSLTDSACISSLISSIRDLLLKDDPKQMTADMPQRVTTITKTLKESIATTPSDLDPVTKAALIETLDGLSMSLAGDSRHMISLSPANAGAIESEIKTQKSLILRGGKRDINDVFNKLDGLPGSTPIVAQDAIAEILSLQEKLLSGIMSLISDILKYVTNSEDYAIIELAKQNLISNLQNVISGVITTINLNETSFNSGDPEILNNVKTSLSNGLNETYFKESRSLLEITRSTSLGADEPVNGVISQLSSVFIAEKIEKEFNTIQNSIYNMVKAGPVNGVPVSTVISGLISSAKINSDNSLNTIVTSIKAMVTDSTVSQLIRSYTDSIKSNSDSLYSSTQAIISSMSSDLNNPDNASVAKNRWDQTIGTLYASTVESMDNNVSNIQNVVQTTFTAAEMKEVANSIRLSQQKIYETISSVQGESSDSLKRSIDELSTLYDGLQILSVRVSRETDDIIEDEEDPIITPPVDNTDDFYLDSGFATINRPSEGPLSNEEEENYKKMMTSGGDIDVDDPDSINVMTAALYSNDTIKNRTFILGSSSLIEYMAG